MLAVVVVDVDVVVDEGSFVENAVGDDLLVKQRRMMTTSGERRMTCSWSGSGGEFLRPLMVLWNAVVNGAL